MHHLVENQRCKEFFPLLKVPSAGAPVSDEGGKPFKNELAFWNGRIRCVPHTPVPLEGKALNKCSTDSFCVQIGTQGRNAIMLKGKYIMLYRNA